MAIDYNISDNTSVVIDRDEAQKKLDRLEFYLHRVHQRLEQVKTRQQNNLESLSSNDKTLLVKGLQLFKLKKKVSREL
ncbi:hypothetical protein DID77_00025 [Candidatus Marinamargulisbacteria bacterium SCGC AG-439-L15]|nr:hypothetical protein DID77_00025 [Candidatus Marinamargulisbacteria bacterium SCGC AG-439-L15]